MRADTSSQSTSSTVSVFIPVTGIFLKIAFVGMIREIFHLFARGVFPMDAVAVTSFASLITLS